VIQQHNIDEPRRSANEMHGKLVAQGEHRMLNIRNQRSGSTTLMKAINGCVIECYPMRPMLDITAVMKEETMLKD
jgi:hypothetical protein